MLQYHFSAKTDVGLVRKANEDFLGNAETPNGHVFVVCDGMGGHVGGARASNIAVQSILEFFSKQEYENIITALYSSLQFANEQIYAVAINEPELKGMGTTAVVLILKGDRCFIGHVGDSRIYIKSDGCLNRLTKDHSFVQTLVDQGLISDDEAETHPQKNQILKALGIAPIIEPTISDTPIQCKKGDVFLLCTDGMNGMVNDNSMEMMVDENDLERSSSILIQAAKDGGGHDNVTVTLVGIIESPHHKSLFKHYNPTNVNTFGATVIFDIPNDKGGKSWMKNKFFYASLILAVFALGIAGWFLLKNDNIIVNSPPPKYYPGDVGKLSNMSLEELEEFKNENVKFKANQDTLYGSNCNCQIILQDSVIAEIITNKKKTKGEVPEVNSQPRSSQTNQGQSPADTATRTKNSNCGKEITHIVKTGESYDRIFNKYKSNCDSISVDYLKSKSKRDLQPSDTLKFECLCKMK